MRTIPFTLPSAHVSAPGVVSISDQDVGGYDFMVGGYGFRLATDQQFPYVRGTEPTTTHRFDSSLEPGEQSLSPLPWIKSQSSFHGGAGQLNLEQGFTAFQYQQEQVEHIRFDNCLGVDVWTPGQVTRLPDTRFFNFGFTSTAAVTATVGGIDYAIIGGAGGLYQAAWLSGPDADPTVTRISMANSTYVSDANCTITSLATDGYNYYGVVQLAAAGYNPFILTYIFAGVVNSTATPEAIYRIPNLLQGPTLHNLVSNPSFENDTAGWDTFTGPNLGILTGRPPAPTFARSTLHAAPGAGAASCEVTCQGAAWHPQGFPFSEGEGLVFAIPTTVGDTYTLTVQAYVPSGSVAAVCAVAWDSPATDAINNYYYGASTTALDTWQTLELTMTAKYTTTYFGVGIAAPSTFGQKFYVDAVMVQSGGWATINYFDGDTTDTSAYNYQWDGTAGSSTSTATPLVQVAQTPGVVGWQKARLVGLLGRALYQLDPKAAVHSDLPTDANYVNPSPGWTWSAIAESPVGILAAGTAGNQASILEFTLDSSGGTPFLTGGSSIAQLPIGETINMMEAILGSWLALGTNKGVRIGDFDTYTGRLKVGPLSVATTQPVLDVATRDRFVYASYTDQQADGKTGLVRVDLSLPVDVAGRLAYAPDLRPPTSAPTGLGAVTSVNVLPYSGRMLFVTPEGLHIEGSGPGSDGDAWLRTSRIRWDTAELKLFKLGRVHGALDLANIQVTGIAPYGVSQNLGTFGFFHNTDPGEFRLVGGTNEWMQLQFGLVGSACVLNSYQAKAYPAPQRQNIIQLTANCFVNETDRYGLDVTDPQTPRQRLQNVKDLEALGNETRLVEFTNFGPVAQLVLIDQIEFRSYSRPNVEDDLGGYITFRLRSTEN